MKRSAPPFRILIPMLIAVSSLMISPIAAQTILIDSIFSTDGEIFPFEPDDTIYGLSISGSLNLNSDTSLVRVILTDEAGHEWMVYEAYPMILPGQLCELNNIADETKYLQVFSPNSIQIQITDANITLDFLNLLTLYSENLETQQQSHKAALEERKVDSIQYYIAENQMIWFAGKNKISDKSYFQKKQLFGNKYNIYGLDYYIGGIFDHFPIIPGPGDNSSYIPHFDWREKHNAHLSTSMHYYDGDPDITNLPCNTLPPFSIHELGNGWMTKVKDQTPFCEPLCTNGCYIFGPLGCMEAIVNLYYNSHYDLDLSEQYVLNCDGDANGCAGGSSDNTFDVAIDVTKGIPDEFSVPWIDQEAVCTTPQTYISKLFITGRESNTGGTMIPPPVEEIKQMLLMHGPLSVLLDFPGMNHYVVLVGYGILKEGDTIYKSSAEFVIIEEGSRYIGSLYWICKNSWGPDSGDQGYYYFICNPLHDDYYEILSYTYVVLPINVEKPIGNYQRHCNDFDQDGYYNWGLGPKPENLCEMTCGDLPEDCNDDNKRIGPCDGNFFETPISPELEVYLYKPFTTLITRIENNSILSFSEFIANNTIYLKIFNPGSAKLHLQLSEGEGPVIILQGDEKYSITLQPDTGICMLDESLIEIHFSGIVTDVGAFKIDVASIDEDVLSDIEFALVLDGCQTQQGYDEIEGEVTWSDMYMFQPRDVHILRNAVLTVNSTIILPGEADIVVEAGGLLILDGGKLTGGCLWNGVDLGGNQRYPQFPEVQGVMRIINGGTIEFARCGIENATYDGQVYSYSGGIINADSAIFKDNLIGIKFWPYHNFNPETEEQIYNFSRVENSVFVTTKDLYDLTENPSYFINMLEVEGIYILGCSFYNELSVNELEEGQEQGIGIFSTEADFIVDHLCKVQTPPFPCSDYKPCNFENLQYGIKTSYITSSASARIRNSDFVNNKTGIYLGVCAFPEIVMNTFHVRKAEPVPFNETVYCGLYLDRSTGYQVEENVFYSFMEGMERENFQAVGLVVNNSGPDNNEIYKNTFDGLYAGLIAQEVNRNEDGGKGLRIRCNIFENDIFDIAVTNNSENVTGIAKDQGSEGNYATAPAGNQFTFVEQDPDPEGNYYNVCENITYYHHANTTGFNLIPDRHTPDPAVKPTPGQYLELFDMELSCPSNLSGGGSGIEEKKSAMLVADQYADSIKNLLNILIDDGNTEGLLTEIQTSWPENGYELYLNLISASPYLSDTSMVESVGKEDVLLPGMITDILIANPQSSKSEDVMTAVDERTNPLTDDQLADIGEGRFIIGAKEELEMDYTYHLYLKDLSQDNLIRLYKSDTLINSPGDSIVSIINLYPNLSYEYFKAFEYLKMGDSMHVSTTLDAIPGNFELNSIEQLEFSLFENYFELLLLLDSTGSKMLEMDSAQVSLCYNILNSATGILKGYVCNLLVMNDSLEYHEAILMPEPGLKSGKGRVWPVKKQIVENFLKIYPNPAKNVVIIETRLTEEPQDALINFIDNKGIKFKSYPIQKQNEYLVISLSDFPSGVLFCQLINRNSVIESRKLIILK